MSGSFLSSLRLLLQLKSCTYRDGARPVNLGGQAYSAYAPPPSTYCAVVTAAALVYRIEQVRQNISGRLGFVKKCALNVKNFCTFSMTLIALKLLVPTKFETVPLVLLNSDN